MLTSDIRNQIDRIGDAFPSGRAAIRSKSLGLPFLSIPGIKETIHYGYYA